MLTLLLISIACAIAGASLASSKNRSVAGWAAICFATGIIGLLIVACIPPLNEEKGS